MAVLTPYLRDCCEPGTRILGHRVEPEQVGIFRQLDRYNLDKMSAKCITRLRLDFGYGALQKQSQHSLGYKEMLRT